MSIIDSFKEKLFPKSKKEITEQKSPLAIARIVFNENTDFSIQKTWLTEIQDTSVLVPKEIRKDTTGRKHLTNDINSGKMYKVGILLNEPKKNEWVWGSWRRENTAIFRGYITQKNHITIPIEIRNKHEITDGDKVQIAVANRIFESETNTPYKSHIPEWRKHDYK